jgi:hypothetical protein
MHSQHRIRRHLPELSSADGGRFLGLLVRDQAFLARYIAPLLARVPPARAPLIAATYGLGEAENRLQVFVWPAGAATPIHDHTSWGVYHVFAGTLEEQRYARLDDGAQPSIAQLRRAWRRAWRRQDGASTVGPYEQGIHRVANRTSRPAISLHLYGPRTGTYDGRDYDPARDFVCDRIELDDTSVGGLAGWLR